MLSFFMSTLASFQVLANSCWDDKGLYINSKTETFFFVQLWQLVIFLFTDSQKKDSSVEI